MDIIKKTMLLGFMGAVIGGIWLLISIRRSGRNL